MNDHKEMLHPENTEIDIHSSAEKSQEQTVLPKREKSASRLPLLVMVVGLFTLFGMFRLGGMGGQAVGSNEAMGCGGALPPQVASDNKADTKKAPQLQKARPDKETALLASNAKPLALPDLLLKIKKERKLALLAKAKQPKIAQKIIGTEQEAFSHKGQKETPHKPLPLQILLAKLKKEKELRPANTAVQVKANTPQHTKPLPLDKLLEKIRQKRK